MVIWRSQTWLELRTMPYNFVIDPTVDKITRRGIPPKWVDFAASGTVVRVRNPNARLVCHPVTCTRKTAFILTNWHIYLHKLSLWVPDVTANYKHSRGNWTYFAAWQQVVSENMQRANRCHSTSSYLITLSAPLWTNFFNLMASSQWNQEDGR